MEARLAGPSADLGMPLVSVLMPARNEERDIGESLRAVLAQDYPSDRMEILVADGDSQDRTAAIARTTLSGSSVARWDVIFNPAGTTPSSLNAALCRARGEIVCRVDARSFLPPEYVRRCVAVLSDSKIVVVGGAQVAEVARDSNLSGRGIARALRSPWVTGGARYRRPGAGSGPSDTVYLGAFRTADLRDVGGWNERFATNQDYELNRRLGRRGLVWFCADLAVSYRPRTSLTALAHQYRRFGRWKAAGWLEGDVPMGPRHVGLLAAAVTVAGVGLAAVRRRPWLAVSGTFGSLLLVDRFVPEPASAGERMISALASVILVGSWLGGVFEGVLRHVTGQRLLAPLTGQRAEPAVR